MQIIAKFDNLLNRLNKHGEEYGFPYILFAAFMLFNYLVEPFIEIYYLGVPDEALFSQMLAAIFCLILVLKKFWPNNCKKYYVLMWLIFIMWCMPFRMTLFVLQDKYSIYLNSINVMLIIFTIVLIVDWIAFVSVLIIGVTLGFLAQHLFYGQSALQFSDIRGPLFTFVWTILTGLLFSRNTALFHKNLLLQRKLAAIRTVASMAHELRNPLATIRMSNSGIRKCFVILMENYNLAQQAKLNGPTLHTNQIEGLGKVFNNIEAEVNFSNTMIDTLLANTKEMATQPTVSSSNQISSCIQAAINRYPFTSDEQRKLVHLDLKHDFTYQGDDLMVTHVFFNLLKNAIQVINEQHKGEIYISLDSNEKYNLVRFKDTAKGMSPETQAKIFQSFYTETATGTGVGLAFCTMIMKGLRGKIEVKSELGVFTDFTLSFPKAG